MMRKLGGAGFFKTTNVYIRDPKTMRAFRNIIHIGLVLAILSTGMPVYHPGDANRDDRVDLADAILSVRGVVKSAEQPAAFRSRLEAALITLSAVAGFQKVMTVDRSASIAPIYSLDSPYLISAFEFTAPCTAAPVIDRGGSAYRSVTISPDPHPPRSL
jgi:hypothetical protein